MSHGAALPSRSQPGSVSSAAHTSAFDTPFSQAMQSAVCASQHSCGAVVNGSIMGFMLGTHELQSSRPWHSRPGWMQHAASAEPWHQL